RLPPPNRRTRSLPRPVDGHSQPHSSGEQGNGHHRYPPSSRIGIAIDGARHIGRNRREWASLAGLDRAATNARLAIADGGEDHPPLAAARGGAGADGPAGYRADLDGNWGRCDRDPVGVSHPECWAASFDSRTPIERARTPDHRRWGNIDGRTRGGALDPRGRTARGAPQRGRSASSFE